MIQKVIVCYTDSAEPYTSDNGGHREGDHHDRREAQGAATEYDRKVGVRAFNSWAADYHYQAVNSV